MNRIVEDRGRKRENERRVSGPKRDYGMLMWLCVDPLGYIFSFSMMLGPSIIPKLRPRAPPSSLLAF
jgi:hypothetical protein